MLISKGQSPIQLYKKDMNERYINYSVDRSASAYKKVIKYLDSDKKLTDKVIENAMQIIKDEFLDIPLSIKIALEKNTKAVWKYKRHPLKPIKKGISKADPVPFDETVIINIDPDTIVKLTNADIIWIMNHAAGSEIADQIATLMEQLKLQSLTMYETARELQKVFSEFTPVKFKELFGEERYWKIVTQSATSRISSYALIDDFELAGYDYYQWVTRGDDKVCPICEPLDGTIYKVSDARQRINDYYAASEIEDTEEAVKAMKEADPWLKKGEDVPDGIMPQVHAGCYCEIVAYLQQSN